MQEIDHQHGNKVLDSCSSRQEHNEQVSERSQSGREQCHDLALEGMSTSRVLKFGSEDTEGVFMSIYM